MNFRLTKVCGMREAENIREVEALGIDMMGFIFWKPSSRYVDKCPTYLPTQCKRVGVFVDEEPQQILQTAETFRLDFIQLHGHESPQFIRQLLGMCGDAYSIIKAFTIADSADFDNTTAYEGLAKYFLFDTKAQLAGGNGMKFDWSLLSAYQGQTPFLLSGGIGPNDAALLKAFTHPQCIGIDLNSRFEVAPGLKDINKIRTFIKTI